MKKAVLVVLDGWGIRSISKGNAIKLAKTPNFDRLKKENFYQELYAAEEYVGLMPGFMGNSEVGHLHIGAGRLVKQDLTRIHDSIKNGSFFTNKVLIKAMKNAKTQSLHLMGLISDAGVHSHITHLFALLKFASKFKLKKVFVHCITDGRDTQPKSALKYIELIEKELRKYNQNWKIATVIGRYYAMDRNNNWPRTKKAYDNIKNGKGLKFSSAESAVRNAYKKGESDEFITPSVINSALPDKNDTMIFFNYRADRARQITKLLSGNSSNFFCFTQYAKTIKNAVFPPIEIKNTLGEVLSNHKLSQFRLAETEKWAHVTFFFNGLSDRIFKGEERLLIPSPKVSTYDKTPAMSAFKIAKKTVELINKKKHGFVFINFANPDMIGHTGKIKKAIEGIEVVDKCLGEISEACKKQNYALIITADHGNAEEMIGEHITSHSTSKVPFICTEKCKKVKNGALYNIAPTVLKILGIKKPKVMEKAF